MIHKTLRLTAEIICADGQSESTIEIGNYSIIPPTTVGDLGLSSKEQLSIIHQVQNEYLNGQSFFLNKRPESCPLCHAKVLKNGKNPSDFQHLYSNHSIDLQKWACSAEDCTWQQTPSFYQLYDTNMSPELMKLQAELGAEHSYRKSEKILSLLVGKRRINNKSRIHRTTTAVGEKIEQNMSDRCANDNIFASPVDKLVMHVDGAYIHDNEKRGHNFEAMVAKVYNPENVITVGAQKRPVIKTKHCAGSAKKDHQATMKERTLEACKLEGLNTKTIILALSDGAKNCWNIINSLIPHCAKIIGVLDWFHVTKYITTVKNILPNTHAAIIEAIKEKLWHGLHEEAQQLLVLLKKELTDEKHVKKIENFSTYISDNIDYIVNYNERHQAGLLYTSSVAESTVEHYASARFRKSQKMQWNRINAHGVLQIRASVMSGDWEVLWNDSGGDIFKHTA
eukprot:Seg17563.1 transcript_id=Seg17563.1/GoldUCD/mRNA.D3Y31 product="hypothetical protein" protein_id=Seg17563.1/GoldUCD/D3Y31